MSSRPSRQTRAGRPASGSSSRRPGRRPQEVGHERKDGRNENEHRGLFWPVPFE
jgi:hypothetical protein